MNDAVDDFAFAFPDATAADWAAFARRMGEEGERRGYALGWEAALREDDGPTPDEVADTLTPGWREQSPAVNMNDVGALAVDAMIVGDSRDYGGG